MRIPRYSSLLRAAHLSAAMPPCPLPAIIPAHPTLQCLYHVLDTDVNVEKKKKKKFLYNSIHASMAGIYRVYAFLLLNRSCMDFSDMPSQASVGWFGIPSAAAGLTTAIRPARFTWRAKPRWRFPQLSAPHLFFQA